MTRAAAAGPFVIQNSGGDPFERIERRLAGTREVQPRETSKARLRFARQLEASPTRTSAVFKTSQTRPLAPGEKETRNIRLIDTCQPPNGST
jgi:hypothetical protein